MPGIINKFDLVIFDCDGVLVDNELLSAEALVEALADQGIHVDVEYVLRTYLGCPPKAIQEDIRTLTGSELGSVFFKELTQRLIAKYRLALKPMFGVDDLLRTLRIPFCVASSSSPERLVPTLALAGLDDYFKNRIFSAAEVRYGKPAPDLFLHAAAQCGVDPAACLVIEDSLAGLQAAHAAGMQCWMFLGGIHFRRVGCGFDADAAGAEQTFDCMQTMSMAMLAISADSGDVTPLRQS